MLKIMGERTPPCGTPDLNCRFYSCLMLLRWCVWVEWVA